MRGIKLLSFLLLIGNFSWAQIQPTDDSTEFKMLKARDLKSFGKNAMIQGDFTAASRYFERYLKLRPGAYKQAYSLGEAYRINRDYLSALKWYQKSFELSKNEHVQSLFYIAQMQKMSGDCKTARENFLKFRKQASGNEDLRDLSKLAKNEIAGCDSLADKKSFLGKLIVNHLDSTINKVHIEASPVFINDSTIFFSSLRVDGRVFEFRDSVPTHLRKFYMANRTAEAWQFAGEMPGFNSGQENYSSGSFNPDRTRFYFSKCTKNWKEKMICALYVSTKNGNEWSEPEKLNKNINKEDHSSSHPSVGFDPVKNVEVIYFVSDRKGGAGKNDIWYFTFNQKKNVYSIPKTAGNKVNTINDELSPFYDNENRLLYYSSNGWPGLGGHDIFRSRGEYRKFTLPENIGSPVNSSYDELFFTSTSDRSSGLFTSNRPGTYTVKAGHCCDDIYEYKRVEMINILLNGTVTGGIDSVNQKALHRSTLALYLVDEREPEPVFIKNIETDENGKYSIPLEAGSKYKVNVGKQGYFYKSFDVDTRNISRSVDIKKDVALNYLPEDVITLDNVYYETDKYELLPASRIAIDTTLLKMMTDNPHLKIEIRSHTDDQASDAYNMKLSQNRAEGVVKYLISKGIEKERLKATGFGESSPIAPNKKPDGSDNPEGRKKNRRTEFKVIGTIERTRIINYGEE